MKQDANTTLRRAPTKKEEPTADASTDKEAAAQRPEKTQDRRTVDAKMTSTRPNRSEDTRKLVLLPVGQYQAVVTTGTGQFALGS